MIRALVFDLDGTIVQFSIDYMAVRAEAIQALRELGIPPSLLSMNEPIFDGMKRAELYLKNNGESQERIEQVRRTVYSIADKHEMNAAKLTSLTPGALDALRALKEDGLKLGIFTLNGRLSVDYVLNRLQLKQFFDSIITRDEAPALKPDPAHLNAVLKELRVRPEETAVVGDTVRDMKSARALGALAIGITTGLADEKALRRAGAEHIIDALTELPQLIRCLNQS